MAELTEALREIAGRHCEIESRGRKAYCYSHHSPATDQVACSDAEELVEDAVGEAVSDERVRVAIAQGKEIERVRSLGYSNGWNNALYWVDNGRDPADIPKED